MNTKVSKKIEIDLTEIDIKNAICHFIKSLPSKLRELDDVGCEDFDIDFNCEMSSPDTFGEVTAKITINQTL